MNQPRILIAGIGNIFLGDDGFGVAVAQRLLQRSLPAQVIVMDIGTRGVDLTYALMDDYDAVVLIDATARGNTPGTLYVIELETDLGAAQHEEPSLLDMHSVDPVRVLTFLRACGVRLGRVRLVGCEPASFGSLDAPQDGLSPQVAAVVDDAVALVEDQLRQLEPQPLNTSNVAASSRHA